MNTKNIISIETSCDDTSIAIISDGKVIDMCTLTSAQVQNTYGGVVPEVAAREHEKNIIPAFQTILNHHKLDLQDLDAIAYTACPGLRVSLNVGEAFATTLAKYLNKPLIKVNHIYGHIFSFLYDYDLKDLEYPFLSLIASGGHTSIFKVNSPTEIELLNETQDDAVGEVFDKVARSLKLGYPGGPAIDKLYHHNQATITFLKQKHSYSADKFSFSGFKTQVLNYINQKQMKSQTIDVNTICSSFQEEITNIMVDKLRYYMDTYNIYNISIGGGVAANSLLQTKIKALKANKTYIPKTKMLCGDNAAMIAIYANLIYFNT